MASDVVIESDGRGNTVAVWVTEDPGSPGARVLEGTVRPLGQDWRPPVVIGPAGDRRPAPALAIDPAGNATVVWSHNLTTFAASRPTDGPWQPPISLGPNALFGDLSSVPDVAVDGAGNLTAAWAHGGDLTISTRPAGNGWQPPLDLGPRASDLAFGPRLSINARGDAAIAWERAVDGESGPESGPTFVRTFEAMVMFRPAGGDWEAPKLLGNGHPSAVADPQGRLTAGWISLQGDGLLRGKDVLAAMRGDDATWSPGTVIDQAGDTASIGVPELVVSQDGTMTMAWTSHSSRAGATVIRTATRSPGGGWSTSSRLGPRAAEAVRIAADGQGALTAVWRVELPILDRRDGYLIQSATTSPFKIVFSPPEPGIAGGIRVSVAQMRINQRIAQVVIRRLKALEAHIEDRPAPKRPATDASGRIRLTTAQLRINQRIAEAGLDRANALIAELEQRPLPGRVAPRRLRLSPGGLRVNQQTLQQAIVRINGIERALGGVGS